MSEEADLDRSQKSEVDAYEKVPLSVTPTIVSVTSSDMPSAIRLWLAASISPAAPALAHPTVRAKASEKHKRQRTNAGHDRGQECRSDDDPDRNFHGALCLVSAQPTARSENDAAAHVTFRWRRLRRFGLRRVDTLFLIEHADIHASHCCAKTAQVDR